MLKKTKRVIFSTISNEDYMKACKRMENDGIDIDKVSYDEDHGRYDIHILATKEEAYKLLDLTTEYNAVLWRGES